MFPKLEKRTLGRDMAWPSGSRPSLPPKSFAEAQALVAVVL